MEKQTTARLLFLEGSHTQRSIAQAVGVSERTVHSWIKVHGWDRLRQAARTAPIVIADNILSQVVELQNDIASREEGKRYPSLAEAELTRKLVLSLDRMKSAPCLSQTMQVLQVFRSFAADAYDMGFRHKLNSLMERFIEGKARDGYLPYQAQYGPATTPAPEFPADYERLPLIPVDASAHHQTEEIHGPLLTVAGESLHPEIKPEITSNHSAETPSHTTSQPISGTSPTPAETGSKTAIAPPAQAQVSTASPLPSRAISFSSGNDTSGALHPGTPSQ